MNSEQNTTLIFINRIRESKAYRVITSVIFSLAIIFFAFAKVNKGIDISDSAYSPGNFVNLNSLDGMWYYSTFYANLLGKLFTKLPYGETLLGLNIYTGLIKLAIALFAYYFFTAIVKVPKELAFIGVLASIGLCWCPSTILYNYLTYLFFFLGCALFYIGLIWKNKASLVFAGFILGCSFFVRLPNICECALIAALWIYALLTKDKEWLKETLLCILGYVLSFIPAALLIFVTRGFNAYFTGISQLFEMTGEASGYSSVSMVISIIRQYIETAKYLPLALLTLLLSAFVFKLFKERFLYLKLLLSVLNTAVFTLLLYKQGLFNLNFHWFQPVYRFGALILIFAILTFLLVIFNKSRSEGDKLLALISIFVIAITPIGSNNDIYSNLNNLFIVLPAFLYFVCGFAEKEHHAFNGVRFGLLTLTGVWVLFSLKFGLSYVFRDGLDGEMDTTVTNNPVLAGMLTTSENAQMLTEITDVWEENDFSDGEAIYYGEVCGLSFYMRTPPALSSSWPSLDSFSVNKFETELKNLEGLIDEKGEPDKLTLVISSVEEEGMLSETPSKKQEILKTFLDKYGVTLLYTCDSLNIYTVNIN